METLPPLRADIELIPARLGDRDTFFVRDPLGIVRPDAPLSPDVVPYLPLFDGSKTASDLQVAMMRRRGGALVFRSEVDELVAALDRLGLLTTPAYREARARIAAEFTGASTRPAALAGSAYPADPHALGALIDGILAEAEQPPAPGIAGATPCALAAPHIDLRAGRKTYAVAYRAVQSAVPEAVLLLGTGHALATGRYCVSGKTFVTPLGSVRADRSGVEALRAAAPQAVAPDDFPHRSEHSLEFQLLFLQRLFPMESIPILPVLCGPVEDLFGRVGSPLEEAGIAASLAALQEWLAVPPARKLVVAGVDLSHVGPKFGDPQPARAMEGAFRAFDEELLGALEAGDAQRFFAAGAAAANCFRVCGFFALWTLLALLPGAAGTVLDYGIFHEEATRSAVSFAAVVFRPPSAP